TTPTPPRAPPASPTRRSSDLLPALHPREPELLTPTDQVLHDEIIRTIRRVREAPRPTRAPSHPTVAAHGPRPPATSAGTSPRPGERPDPPRTGPAARPRPAVGTPGATGSGGRDRGVLLGLVGRGCGLRRGRSLVRAALADREHDERRPHQAEHDVDPGALHVEGPHQRAGVGHEDDAADESPEDRQRQPPH